MGRSCDKSHAATRTYQNQDQMEWVQTIPTPESVYSWLGQILEPKRWLSPEAESCLNLIPREWKVFSEDTRISLEDLQAAIRHTKKNTSARCCGWTQPDWHASPLIYWTNSLSFGIASFYDTRTGRILWNLQRSLPLKRRRLRIVWRMYAP